MQKATLPSKIINPATGKSIGTIPVSKSADVEQAVKAAKEAFKTWSKTTPEQRFRVMNKIADLIESKLDDWPWPKL